MINEINYPIVYAIYEVKEQNGFVSRNDSLEENYETVAFIVAKAFLISEEIVYFKDGTCQKTSKVVFPYKNLNDLNKEREIPSYTKQGDCYNAELKLEVFTNYNEAKKVAERLNKELKLKKIPFLASNSKQENDYQLKSEKFDESLNKYLAFEDSLLEITQDLLTIDEQMERKL